MSWVNGKRIDDFAEAKSEKKNRIGEDLLDQLKKSQEELKLELKEQGGCDHSVGICACALIALIEDNEAVIQHAEARL